MSPLLIAAAVLAALSLVCLVAGVRALSGGRRGPPGGRRARARTGGPDEAPGPRGPRDRHDRRARRGRRHPAAGAAALLGATALLSLAALLAVLALGTNAYRALTGEELAAVVEVERLGERRWRADFTLPEGGARTLEILGDELYVDARILKWHPWANMMGLRTAYRLDRAGGRYEDLDAERSAPRSIHALVDGPALDPFGAVRARSWLEPLVDAEYGSATFAPLRDDGRYRILVSTTGLLVRPDAP